MTSKKVFSGRDASMDIVKGIGIILVVIGHTKCPDLLKKIIYGFHMPLFFIIAGMLYNKEKWEGLGIEELVKNRAKSYLIPYFALSGINLALNAIDEFAIYNNFKEWLDAQVYHVGWIAYATGLADLSPNCSPLWFLPCLFFSYIIFYYVIRLKTGTQIGVCAMLVLLNKMIYITLPEITPQTLPWHIDTALAGATLMIIGFHIKEQGWQKIAEKNIFIFLSLLGIGGVTGWMNLGKVAFASNRIDNPVCMAVHACAMTLVLIAFGEKICKTAIGGFLIFCGNSTIIFMGFNYFFNRHSERLWQSLPILNKFEYHWVIKVIVVTACLCLTSYLWNLVKTHGINCHRWLKKDNCGKESG